jgi:carboxyl-terminal processing protease
MRFFVAGAVILTTLGFVSGFAIGGNARVQSALPATVAQAIGAEVPPRGVDLSPVWKAWRIMDEQFVPASVPERTASSTEPEPAGTPEERRVYGMIQGLAASLGDPYTFFLPPVEQKQFEEDLSGEFSGVGMEIEIKDEVLTVVAPLKGTPADKAGIKPNDVVIKIDGISTTGLDITSAVNRIRGPKGSTVVLHMMRDGWTEPRDVSVVRDTISLPIIDTEDMGNGIYVISLHNFTANSPQLFRTALREFVESGNRKLILDVRGNPGGYLEAAVDMASWFLPSGKIVVTEDYAGHQENVHHRSRGYDIFNSNLQMVILVDEGSASASEILAGALKHHGKATIVGAPTFGKGSVQELIPITETTGLKITVARWLMPNGEQIPLDGITPDHVVEVTEEDRAADRDPQMEKAIELLR